MAGGNPFMPPGANPGGPVPQGRSAARDPILGGNRVPGPGVRGTGASIVAPPPPNQPPTGQPMPAVPPSKQGDLFADVHQNFSQAKAMYSQGKQAQQVLDHLREELDNLMEMGDIVRPDDVIEAAGRLVGKGIGATQLAQIMSDMPAQGGEGLASWIRMHDVTITNAEQSLARENEVFRHIQGVEALRSMAATHLDEKTKRLAGQAPQQTSMQAPAQAPMQQPGPMMQGPDQGNDLGIGNGGANA